MRIRVSFKKQKYYRAVVVYTFNPSTQEAEAGGPLVNLAWFT